MLSAAEASGSGTHLTRKREAKGRSLTVTTLNECGGRPASEKSRQLRLQYNYEHDGTVYYASEAVLYSGNGSQDAYNDIRQLARRCHPNRSIGGHNTEVKFAAAGRSHGLLTRQVTTVDLLRYKRETPYWSAEVFQYDGPYFSGVYVYDYNGTRTTALAVARDLGKIVARRMKAAIH